MILLALANEECNTSFDLGIVVEGSNCKWNHQAKNYDDNYAQTRVFMFAKYLEDPTESKPARPLIWLWNDNAMKKYDSWHPDLKGKIEVSNHWEGFGRKASSDAAHLAKVQSWGLTNKVAADVQSGVW